MSLQSLLVPASQKYFEKIIWDFIQQTLPPSLLSDYFDVKKIELHLHKFNTERAFRALLAHTLLKQAQSTSNTSPATFQNIQLLNNSNTFTITTGHQLNLFTGPLFFIYKISSVIQWCNYLKKHYPAFNFVPVFWMASEDHDVDEINHFYFKEHRFQWNRASDGTPVFALSTKELDTLWHEMKTTQFFSEQDLQLFYNAYIQHNTYINATRFLLNELFGKYGLVILDPNEKVFKEAFKEIFYSDIFENNFYHQVLHTVETFKTHHYHIQVNPRPVNTFLFSDNKRYLIQQDKHRYYLKDTEITFSKEALQEMLQHTPEKFSPNVLLRPLLQQKILPNIAYIGGNAEIAYWLQLKQAFDHYSISFPFLIQRPVLFIAPRPTLQKISKLQLPIQHIFEYDLNKTIQEYLNQQQLSIQLSEEKNKLLFVFDQFHQITDTIDKSLVAFVNAEKTKTMKFVETLEQKLNKTIKQKNDTIVRQIESIYATFFPNTIMQDRVWNLFYVYKLLNYSSYIEFIEAIQAFCLPDFTTASSSFQFILLNRDKQFVY